MKPTKKNKQTQRVRVTAQALKKARVLPVVDRKDQSKTLIPEKEAKVIEGVVAGKSVSKAVADAGYNFPSTHNAAAFGNALVKRYTDCNGALVACLENKGVTLEKLAEKLADGLDATTTVKKGSDVEVVPDFGVRHRYLETALEIYPGAKAPKKMEVQQISFEARLVQIAMISGDDE